MDVAAVPDVPEWLVEHLRERGVESLYPPQAAAVEAGVTEGRSLVAAVPTASGKTLVAELAMLSALHRARPGATGDGAGAGPGTGARPGAGAGGRRGGTALYIVPLRALASEKHDQFAAYEDHGVDVAVSTGNYESDGEWLGRRDLVVATSEKVDSLVRNGAPWIEDLDCVVADEVHLVDDGNRGPTLEVTLAKLRRINPDLQVVALSATVGNAEEVAGWLDAELVESTWRPIELRRGVHYGQALHLDDGDKREVPVRDGQKQTAALVEDALGDGGSSLVFVNSRRNAEAAARRLGDAVEGHLDADGRAALADLAAEVRDVGDTETGDDLAGAVESGAAFHHAGLAREHRSLVEAAFRDRRLKVVCATPTLAAGVNTPARRVIVRDWQRYDGTVGGMAPLDTLEVHQMMGRAGRPGLDPYGEAVLTASTHDELDELFERYVWAEPEPIRSKLAAEPALRTHLLATVASGFANTREGLLEFLEGTLYAAQSTEAGRLESVTDAVLDYLAANGFLERDDGAVRATSLGRSVSRLYLDPMSAAEIVDGLRAWASGSPATAGSGRATGARAADGAAEPAGFETARELRDGGEGVAGGADASGADADGAAAGTGGEAGGAEAETGSAGDADGTAGNADGSGAAAPGGDGRAGPTALGLYHLVSRTPDMYELYLRSGDRELYGEVAYDREDDLLGPAPSEYEDGRWEDWLSALKTARLLEDWADELEEERITERYGVGPGDIRGKVETAEWLLNAAETLASELDLEVGTAVQRARMRVEHGVGEELLELTSVRNVGRVRARRLYEAGIEGRADLRAADKSVVLAALRGRRKTAEGILENVGRQDPSMEGVRPAQGATAGGDGDGSTGEGGGSGAGVDGDGSGAGGGSGGAGEAAGAHDDREDEDEAASDQANLGDF